jgi:mannose-1-phosphate guanylyltransferase
MTDLSGWPAMVLTAGLATRLRPLSLVRAKAAMPVAGEPLIGRILQWLRAAGVTRVVLNLHHRPETITRLVGDGSQWGVEVRYSWEREILGSAGGPRRGLPLLDADRFLIINGDTLTDCDLRAVVDRHMRSGALVTMAVVPGDVERYGGVLVRPDGTVTGFARARRTESVKSGPLDPLDLADLPAAHFIGVQAVEAAAFADVPDDRPSETVRTLYPRLIGQRDGSVIAFESRAEFLDVGTARDYLSTVALIARREGRALDFGANCLVHPGASVTDSVLWDRVTVGPKAQLINCVAADDVQVPPNARYEGSVLVQSEDGLIVSSL